MSTGSITEHLGRIGNPDKGARRQALDKVVEFTYQQVYRIIGNKLRQEGSLTTPTAFVRDLYGELDRRRNPFQDRQHFFRWTKQWINRRYISYLRRRKEFAPLDTEIVAPSPGVEPEVLIDIERALAKLPPKEYEFVRLLADDVPLAEAARTAGIPGHQARTKSKLIFAKLACLLGYGAHS